MEKAKKQMIIGGQAVIEGVMMKSPNHVVVAVRKPDKTIAVKEIKYSPMAEKYPFLKMPFFRGIMALFEMLVIGARSLSFSANEAAADAEHNTACGKKRVKKQDNLKCNNLKCNNLKCNNLKCNNLKCNNLKCNNLKCNNVSNTALFFTVSFSLLLAIGLFVAAPYLLTVWIGFSEEAASLLFNLVDGIIKVMVFVAYILVISMMKDVRRVFQYHGAEHKAVNCYEAGKELTVRNARNFSTIHQRCGTSFLMFVILFGIILFSLMSAVIIWLWPGVNDIDIVAKKGIFLLFRFLLLLPLVGLSYEFMKLSTRFGSNAFFCALMKPGLWVQKLTTREPDDMQVEVGIKALKNVLNKEKLN